MDNRKYDISKDSISIGQFVNQYLEIDADCSNLKHIGLRSFCSPLVIGVSNTYADKNPELVKRGFLLIVLDCKKNKGTYINPIKLRELIDKDLIEDELNELEKIRISNLEELSIHYTKYMKILEQYMRLENFYNIVKELNKSDNIELIKMQQGLIDSAMRKEESKNDKYKRK